MKYLAVCFYVVFLFLGCSQSTSTTISPSEVRSKDGKIYIKDRTGKEWEISHAVNNYGFKPNNFQYGLGPNAIRPILSPEFFCPGDPGYPVAHQTNLVIGTTLNGETRAYPIFILKSFEIVDEVFGSTHVAVAY